MIRNIIIILCALSLSGCTNITRPCPGFGTPLADRWSTALNVGDVVTYVSNTGSTVKLELTVREDSEPYEGSSRNGSDEVICFTNSDRLYTIENGDVAMQVRLSQTRSDDPSLEAGESFTIRFRPDTLLDEKVAGYSYFFFLGLQARQRYTDTFGPENDPSIEPRVERFVEDVQVGDNIYPYGIEVKYSDMTALSSVLSDTNSFAGITRMILAEDAGLVQFELLNGEIYSRL